MKKRPLGFYLNEIQDDTIRKTAIDYCTKKGHITTLVNDVSNIKFLFTWSSTPQGALFWDKIYRKIV